MDLVGLHHPERRATEVILVYANLERERGEVKTCCMLIGRREGSHYIRGQEGMGVRQPRTLPHQP
jgi:hypothetical protein